MIIFFTKVVMQSWSKSSCFQKESLKTNVTAVHGLQACKLKWSYFSALFKHLIETCCNVFRAFKFRVLLNCCPETRYIICWTLYLSKNYYSLELKYFSVFVKNLLVTYFINYDSVVSAPLDCQVIINKLYFPCFTQ